MLIQTFNSYHFFDINFWRKVINIGLPISLSSMAIAMLGVVDVAMVSSLGQNDLAAVSYGARLMFFAFFFAVGWCGGLAILAPQFIGANKLKELRKTTVMAFYVLGSMLSLLITLFIFYSEWLAEIANTSPEFVSVTSQYISIASFSLIFTAIILPIEINLRALGKTRLTSVMSLVSVLLNMLFNYVLIFGKFGLPELGVMGAALGTVLARFLHTIILLIIITPNKEGVFPNLKQFLQFDKLKELKNYLSLTLPILLQNVGWSLGLVMYNVLLGQMGVEELALFGLINPMESLLMAFFYGFAMASATLLGQKLGASNFDLAYRQSVPLIVVPVVFSAIFGLIIWALTPVIANVYAHADITRIDYSLVATMSIAACLCIRVFNMVVINGVLNSGGDVKYTMVVNIVCLWGISLPLALFCIKTLGLDIRFVVIAILSEDIVKAILVYFRLRKKMWLKNLVTNMNESC